MTLSDLSEKQLASIPKEQRAKLGKAAVTYAEAQDRAAHKSEREMQQMIAAWIRQKGWFYVVQAYGRKATGLKGQPDFIVCVPRMMYPILVGYGQFVAIECKMPGGKLRPEQGPALENIRKTGGLALVATSAKQAIDWLIEISK